MNAPADSSTRPDGPTRSTAPTEPDTSGPPPWAPPRDRRRLPRPSISPAGWLAGIGTALLLVASVIVVAGRWESIPAEIRFAGLVAALVATSFAADAVRRRLPITARAMATLAATMSAPAGVAAAATLDLPWPVCVLVGGILAVAATELQARRWNLPLLQAATLPAFGLVVAGGAALTGVPVALLGAGGAVLALALGAARRGVALAVAVGLSPLLVLLAEAGVGAGTLNRIGAVGGVLSWSAPLAGVVAAAVVGIVAERRQHLPLAVVAVTILGSGAVTGLAAGDVASVVWWCLPAVGLLALESLGTSKTPAMWRRLSEVAPLLAAPIAIAGLLAPLVVLADRVADRPHAAQGALPLLVSGLALLATAAGSARRDRSGWARTLALLGAAGCVVAGATVAGATLVVAGGLALLLGIAASALAARRTWELTSAVSALWGLIAITADAAEPVSAQLAVVAGFAGVLVLAAAAVERRDHGLRLVAIALVVAAAVQAVAGGPRAVEALLAIVAVVAFGVALRPQRALVPMVVAEAAVVLSFLDGRVDWWNVAAIATLAIGGAAAADRSLRSPWAHLSSGALTAAFALAMIVAGLDVAAVTLLLGVAAVALTGLAMLHERHLPDGTAAAVAGALGIAVSLAAEPVLVSLAVTLGGAQAVVFGAASRIRPLSIGGGIGIAGGVLSLWWTTGTNALVLDAIAPYGATGADVVVAVTGLLLLGLGFGLRHAVQTSSWLAYGPGLGLLATWLLATQLESGTDWATFGAFVVGTVASGIGGVRRLGAPLLIGSATLTATVLISAGPRLAEAPTWAWIALGGLGLLALAALVERDERPLLPSGDDDTPSLVESFRREFE